MESTTVRISIRKLNIAVHLGPRVSGTNIRCLGCSAVITRDRSRVAGTRYNRRWLVGRPAERWREPGEREGTRPSASCGVPSTAAAPTFLRGLLCGSRKNPPLRRGLATVPGLLRTPPRRPGIKARARRARSFSLLTEIFIPLCLSPSRGRPRYREYIFRRRPRLYFATGGHPPEVDRSKLYRRHWTLRRGRRGLADGVTVAPVCSMRHWRVSPSLLTIPMTFIQDKGLLVALSYRRVTTGSGPVKSCTGSV